MTEHPESRGPAERGPGTPGAGPGGPPSGEPSAGGPAARPAGEPPLGQRIYDNPFLLLVAGIVVMGIFYTAWGLWQVVTLPPAPLP